MSQAPMVTVSSGLLEAKHADAIGAALWVFLLLIHWQTGRDGKVKGGAPIKPTQIASVLGCSPDTAGRHLSLLAGRGYITISWTGRGWSTTVNNPKKWFSRVGKNADAESAKMPTQAASIGKSADSESAKMPTPDQKNIGEKYKGAAPTSPPAQICPITRPGLSHSPRTRTCPRNQAGGWPGRTSLSATPMTP